MSHELTDDAALLSIVIPVGGVDEWLDETVASAVAAADRLEDARAEIIAVFNNGAEVPEGWHFLTDPRVRVLYDPAPLGPGGAGQAGIDAAHGDYFVCLDADDRMRPDRLVEQLAWMQSHPDTVLVSSQVDWINEHGENVGAFDLPASGDVRERLIDLNVCPHSAWMARMDAVRSIGGYDLSMNQMEDYDMLLRLGVLGPIGVLPNVLTEYRLHSGQMSRAVRPNGHYVHTIGKQRRALGAALGLPRLKVKKAQLWWEAQQWLMFFGRKIRGVVRSR